MMLSPHVDSVSGTHMSSGYVMTMMAVVMMMRCGGDDDADGDDDNVDDASAQACDATFRSPLRGSVVSRRCGVAARRLVSWRSCPRVFEDGDRSVRRVVGLE